MFSTWVPAVSQLFLFSYIFQIALCAKTTPQLANILKAGFVSEEEILETDGLPLEYFGGK